MDRANSPINSLLEQAACIVRRSKATAGTLEPTESYKRGQIEELKSFADSLNLWIDLSGLDITYMDKGGENEVFHDGNTSVIKLNNFEYAGDDLENFFIRIFAHNRFSRARYLICKEKKFENKLHIRHGLVNDCDSARDGEG